MHIYIEKKNIYIYTDIQKIYLLKAAKSDFIENKNL